MVALIVHVFLACVAMFYLYKDDSITISTKVVHGMLAWLVPMIGCVFSINSLFGIGTNNNYHSSSSYDDYSGSGGFDGGGEGGD